MLHKAAHNGKWAVRKVIEEKFASKKIVPIRVAAFFLQELLEQGALTKRDKRVPIFITEYL